MSGGGNGYVSDTGGDGGGRTTACHSIVERAHVSSPDPEVLKKITIGTILDLKIDTSSTPLLLVIAPDGRTLGSVVPSRMARIVSCILNEGVEYMAVVLQIDGGFVQVEIRAKS